MPLQDQFQHGFRRLPDGFVGLGLNPQLEQLPAFPGVDPDQQGLPGAVGGQVAGRRRVASGQALGCGGGRHHGCVVFGGEAVLVNEGRDAPTPVGGKRRGDDGPQSVAAVLPASAVVHGQQEGVSGQLELPGRRVMGAYFSQGLVDDFLNGLDFLVFGEVLAFLFPGSGAVGDFLPELEGGGDAGFGVGVPLQQ